MNLYSDNILANAYLASIIANLMPRIIRKCNREPAFLQKILTNAVSIAISEGQESNGWSFRHFFGCESIWIKFFGVGIVLFVSVDCERWYNQMAIFHNHMLRVFDFIVAICFAEQKADRRILAKGFWNWCKWRNLRTFSKFYSPLMTCVKYVISWIAS